MEIHLCRWQYVWLIFHLLKGHQEIYCLCFGNERANLWGMHPYIFLSTSVHLKTGWMRWGDSACGLVGFHDNRISMPSQSTVEVSGPVWIRFFFFFFLVDCSSLTTWHLLLCLSPFLSSCGPFPSSLHLALRGVNSYCLRPVSVREDCHNNLVITEVTAEKNNP